MRKPSTSSNGAGRVESILDMAESLGLCVPGMNATTFDFLDARTGEVFTAQQVWNLYHGRPAGEPGEGVEIAVAELASVCEKAETVFRRYAEMHRLKYTAEDDAKADENERLADEMRAAVLKAIGGLPELEEVSA